jgi:hypothetical protein
MRTLYLLTIIYIALITAACTTTSYKPTTQTTTPKVSPRDPLNVSLLTKEKPARPYTVLGKTTISKFNVAGIKRQEAIMRDIMRQRAAALNGDAVIDVKNNDKEISATVIAYKEILV